ncbi:MAG TPA: MFS transporter [Caulobacteraceae bacterium]|nr:MFS transporter [Caulobacteraceae bacterium]
MNQASPAERPELTVAVKSFYGMGALGASAKAQLFGFLLLFYNQLVGLAAPLVSAAIAIALLIDAFWDPIVGQISDNTRTPWGRRHPYIYGAALPSAICFSLLFMPPRGWSQAGLFLWLLGMVVGVRMFDSLNEIPGGAVGPELTANYEERTSIQSFRYLFGAVAGGALAAILGFGVFLRGTRAERFGQLNIAGYAPYAVTIAAIGLVAVLAQGLATQRFIPFMHRPERRRPTLGAVAREIGLAISNRNFVSLAISGFVFGISIGISGGLLSYLYTYFWELPPAALLVIRLSAIPAGILAVVVAPMLARRFDKKRACITVFFLSIFSTTIPIGARLLGILPPNGSPVVFALLIGDTMMTSILATTGFIIVTSMLMDVVEDTQVRTGRRAEGLLFSVDSLLRKLTTAFSALAPGLIIAYVRFPAHARPGHVPMAILTHLALLYLPLTTGLNLCSTSLLLLYRIDRRRHQTNLEHLAGAARLVETADPIAQ